MEATTTYTRDEAKAIAAGLVKTMQGCKVERHTTSIQIRDANGQLPVIFQQIGGKRTDPAAKLFRRLR
jgi:hypothetical protein